MVPNRQWIVGEPRTSPTGRSLGGFRSQSYWTAPFEIGDSDIEDSLHTILSRLEQHRAFFEQNKAAGGSAELFIGFFLESFNGGFSLQPALLAKCASLGLALDFDIYGQDDDPRSAP
jgi:hypothetical protein